MLDVAFGVDLSVGETATMAHRAESMLDLFIAIFADRLLSEVRRGLPRQYRQHEDDLRSLRGRLDVVSRKKPSITAVNLPGTFLITH